MLFSDFHTHIFPDHIAEQTIHNLQKQSHATAYTNGSLSGLLTSMRIGGINYSVILPVVTKPSQFESINRFASEINGKNGILSFGGIHPQNKNIPEKLKYIKSLGLKGIKLHPDYQGAYIDDMHYIEILQECLRLDLCVVIHSGLDIGLPVPIHCPVDRLYLVLKKVLNNCCGDSKIVLAHVGGHLQWELVEELLIGENVYFDLAFSPSVMEQKTLLRIIKKHGTDHILFATDSPWSNQKRAVDYIKSLPLAKEDLQKIFYNNAAKLLDLPLQMSFPR